MGSLNDLVEMLTRMGIEPAKGEARNPQGRFTEHRVIERTAAAELSASSGDSDLSAFGVGTADPSSSFVNGIALGDKVVLLFSDDQKRVSVRLSEGANDLEKGRLSINSPLGRAIIGAEEGDEVEMSLENGRQRKLLIESVEKSSQAAGVPAASENVGSEAPTVA